MIRLSAPAKLNLSLRVVGRRADGYHEIETLFERIDLCDELAFEPHGELALTCTEPALSCGEDNLVLRAARALQQASGLTRGARIHLAKRIPIAAGLGGGSSDAAAALLGLNALWDLRWPPGRLAELGAGVGSDVAFFLGEAPFAIGRGRGERCEPLAGVRPLAHVLAVPPDRLTTKDIFAAWDQEAALEISLTAPPSSISMVTHALRNGSLGELAKGLRNDLQPIAIRRCPVIATIQSSLSRLGCEGVSVSGSGPAVFGLCRDAAQAEAVAGSLRRHPWRVEVVQTWRGEPASKVSVRWGVV
ncbi:MAG: 4-(cytidine 5'-diphospho)-2-C-methyl-D-erythritol kinase [Candidatus Omnitrophica bacterium]|nr:4-(cytidine 5'-diphospho)-2-C-methyl-D-erythritol kinase [Candidatus Omnitrophota bacterium]